jgi:hypothetical protein
MGVNWPLVLQGMKVVLDPIATASWPIAIGIIAYAFRNPITAMIGRIRQVTGFGGTAEFVTQEAAQQQTAETEQHPSLPAPTGAISPPPPDAVYDNLDTQLTNFLDQNVHGDTSAKLAWAVRARSISEANRLHEMNYRLIFGSQIVALKGLNVTGQGLVTVFENLFETAKTNPANEAIHKERTFDQWLQFLLNTGYVTRVEGSDPPLLQITPFGRQFLQWMVLFAVPEIKAG